MLAQPLISILVVTLSFFFTTGPIRPAEQTKSTSEQSATSVEYLSASPDESRPYSDAVRVGQMLYLSGKLGTDSSGKVVAGGILAETKQVLENLKATLERNGSSLDRVVKCTVMLSDMKEWAAMNSVYMTYFKKGHMPARSAFGVSGLARDGRVEIECVAVVN